MDFGFVSYDELIKESFEFTDYDQLVLTGTKSLNQKMYVGLTRWAADHFNGSLYPPRTKSDNYLREYSKQFNAIELNATHYHIPTSQQVKSWYEKIESDNFHFCPKFSKMISHQGGLKLETKSKLTDSFISTIAGFNDKLGPSFIQLADYVANNWSGQVTEFLNYLPTDMQTFIETRHASWFNTDEQKHSFAKSLQELRVGWVITDTPGRRDVVHQRLTIPHTFIRFVANGTNEIDYYRILQWKKVLTDWFNRGLESCHFFVHVHNKHEEVPFAKYVQAELNEVLNQ